MPRPRFDKLPPEQRAAILRAATDELAAHGFAAASLNRIIDAAGISKGSMYYYFDGKEDLYVHVVRLELGEMLAAAGPFPVPAGDADAFWSTVEGYYLRIMRALVAEPRRAALARDWLVASASSALQQAQREMEAALLPWFAQAIGAGQRAGAVRADVPMGLLIAVVFGMGQAMDMWLVTQEPDAVELGDPVRLLVGMIRGALSPPG